MFINNETELKNLMAAGRSQNWKNPQRMLMVSPKYFSIAYAINPYMVQENGQLNSVDNNLAMASWLKLKSTFEELGVTVHTLPGIPHLPDMVFAANQSFVFWHQGKPAVLMSRMMAPERREEVTYFEDWFKAQGYQVFQFETPGVFAEGNGDLLLDPCYPIVWGGIGTRTNDAAYQEIVQRFQLNVVRMPLRSKDFYHLDTCFSILSADTCVIQPKAFDEVTLMLVRSRFKNVIMLDEQENKKFFTGNCHAIAGKTIVTQAGSTTFKNDVAKAGFALKEVDTAEFMKSGGSVFCMKMMVF
jgi:N-dimethylarginine dimethylaminohydrolase